MAQTLFNGETGRWSLGCTLCGKQSCECKDDDATRFAKALDPFPAHPAVSMLRRMWSEQMMKNLQYNRLLDSLSVKAKK